MSKKSRVSRSKEDLKIELKEQLQILQHACKSYDDGLEAIGKHIALSLRVLLHHHGQSRSLLEQLGLRNKRFFDSAGPLSPTNLLTECNLVGGTVNSSGGSYTPLVQMGGGPIPPRKVEFSKWWNEPVLKDNRGRTFSRRELVNNVANTDGGAHVDPSLEESYMDLSRRNSLGWNFSDGNVEEAFKGRAELACMRQIAHELMISIENNAPAYFPNNYG
ncbi:MULTISPECIES: hypothetical protein [Vibrio]|uniref:hypothetical protein n=1 Tax=Vibrio TaxID=662 RepID=UPI00030E3280|nr:MULTISPECIES: hypothetical protein [Vibrio]OEF69126.1 hypothetical protein A152_19320 [Vibrio tasmaniensis 1F-187]OEF80652.1 hypothetical protein A162_14380 [Vibrio tasmaniensis 1F-155]PMN75088.1 hypothetical protein BCT24_08600 [Vibrio splendidus]PMO81966.1 hypothetical protein BCT01_06015 [Vibrio tasmaniensis]